MSKSIAALLLCSLLSSASLVAAKADTVPQSSGTLPEIYHTTARPLCSALQNKIKPSIGMLDQNDKAIAKSPAFFNEYNKVKFAAGDEGGGTSLALMHLSGLVLPLADNVLAIQKLLNDPNVFPAHEQSIDDQKKNELKKQLLKTLAQQQAALDIINGFVETQDLADMQHQGFGYLQAIAGNDTGKSNKLLAQIQPTANPQGAPPVFDDTLINAGVPANPYEVDVTKIPGLTLGYNPVSKLKDGVEYTQAESKRTESTLIKSVLDAVRLCNGPQNAAPAASPTP